MVSRRCLCWSTPREHKADRRLLVPVRRIPADHKDKEEQEGTACRCWRELRRCEYLLTLKLLCDLCVQKSVGPEQNPLRLPQNQELDQFLKEGCTFTVLDQPLSLDRLQLKNIDQLNASCNKWLLFCDRQVLIGSRVQPFRLSVDKKYHILQLMLIKHTHVVFAASGLPHSFIIMHQNRYQQCIGAFILQAASESNKVDSPRPRGFVLTFPERNYFKCVKRYRNVRTSWNFFSFLMSISRKNGCQS